MLRTLLLLTSVLAPSVVLAAPEHHATAMREGAALDYVDRGAGPVIVMVASLGRGAEDFDALAEWLSDQGFRIICPQARGIGSSAPPVPGASLHDYAADVAAVVEASGAAPVVVLGHAYGNTVARTLAADRPDLVRGVILVAASGRAPLSEAIKDAIAKSSDLSLSEFDRVKNLGAAYFAPGHDATVWLGGWHPETQAAQYKAYAKTSVDDYITAGGHVPILDIQGADDVIIPRQYSKDLQTELGRRVTLVVMPDAGHALLPEQPAAVAAAITAWMGLLDAALPVQTLR